MAAQVFPDVHSARASPLLSAASQRSPALSCVSAPSEGSRKRSRTGEEAFFLLSGEQADGLRERVSSTLAPDNKRRAFRSLQETLDGVRDEYPEEAEAGDLEGVQRRANSDLSELASKLSTPGTFGTPCAPPIPSPKLTPLELPPPAELDLSAARASTDEPIDTACMYQHDGLLDHEMLLQAVYLSQGLDLSAVQGQARQFLTDLGLRPHDLGVVNVDEDGHMMTNQCFYLSIAHGYLGHEAPSDAVAVLALRLKRAIETAVLVARPGWVMEDSCGGEAMAFADFLPIAMTGGRPGGQASDTDAGGDNENLTAALAVCILDSVQGHVEVFVGPRYAGLSDPGEQERNLILLWYTPGHYQCVVRDDEFGSKVWMTYESFKELLTKHGVMYIETTE